MKLPVHANYRVPVPVIVQIDQCVLGLGSGFNLSGTCSSIVKFYPYVHV